MSRTKYRVGLGLAAVMFGVGLSAPASASPGTTAVAPSQTQAVTAGHDDRGGGDWGGGGDWWGGHHNRCWVWRHGHWQFKWWDRWCNRHGDGHGGHGGHGGWHGGR
jgi:hypothetical protein